MLGSPCILPPDYQGQNGHIPYFFIDNLLLAEDIPYDASIAPLGGWCTNDLVLEATPDSLSGDYQWYQEGVALLGETGLTLAISANALPPATYQFRYQLNDTVCVTVPYEVTIPPDPHPSFTVSSPVGCAPHTTTLTSTTAGVTVASCAWDFGIGTSTGTCDTTITYDTPGTYDVTLTVTSAEGCVGDTTVVGAVQVVAPPTAAFTPDATQGCEPLTVNFTNASVGDWTDCAWDFGDGGSAIGCDPTYTFPAAGLYSVSLTISTGGVCGNDTIMDALIEVLPSPVLAPIVDAPAGCRPHTASFSQNVPPGSNLSCAWTFGNGETSSDCAASATYTTAGLYSVSLSATSANGCVSDTVLTDWITVHELPQPDLSADAQAGCPPFLVTFTNTTPPGQSAACAWDFGDGGTSANCAPAYIYTQPGTYAVSLTITSPQGCTADTLFDPYITVYQPPLASFESAVPSQCYSFPFDFTNTSTGSVDCSWAFGDAATSTDCDPQHTYAVAGLYDVTLTVTSAEGCVDDTTAVAYIDAIPEPVPIIGSDTTQGCEALTIQFQNLTDPASVASCAWTFGNGDASTECDPEYTYAAWGTYTVSLTVTAPWGCVNDTVLVDYITAWDRPDPDILAEPRIGCPPLQVDFANATPAGQTAFTAWNFGDGTVSPESDPSHLYLHSGTYNVSLTVVSPMGCWGDSLFSEYITVLPKPQADFTYATTGGDIFWPRFDLFDASSPDVVSWWWSFGEGGRFGTDSVPNTSIIFPEEVAASYPIMLIVADTNQCMDTTVRYITVEDVLTLYVPNSFTPNADDVNELFLPIMRGPEPATYLLSIYDRWGQLQFSSTDPDEGWDGSLGGAPAKEDVYVWQLEFSFVDRNESDRRIGHVTLLR
ncbi:MAG: PKD domain-containing protein [Flavobacteriales bacterium]|nr:PKD domain-containing protein [Flavobacteriales bacterium]